MTKPTKWLCAQRRLRSAWASANLIRVFAVRVKKALVLSYPLSENSDQTGRMPRLIWVFAGRTVTLLVLSCCGSFVLRSMKQTYHFVLMLYPYMHIFVISGDFSYFCQFVTWESECRNWHFATFEKIAIKVWDLFFLIVLCVGFIWNSSFEIILFFKKY